MSIVSVHLCLEAKILRHLIAILYVYVPSMAPHNLWTSRRKAEVQPWTMTEKMRMVLADVLKLKFTDICGG